MDISALGWVDDGSGPLSGTKNIARVTAVHRSLCKGVSEDGELNLHLSGKFQQGVASGSEFPATGDWVRVSPSFVDQQGESAAVIEEILPRRSKVSRVSAGESSDEQIMAANVDYVFVVTSINKDLSVNRLQRYLLLAKDGGVEPVIVVSKIDLDVDYLPVLEELQTQMGDTKVLAVSVVAEVGIDQVLSYMKPGTTSVFVGSSGVGKSTLVNRLLGEEVQLTKEIRSDDDKGKHTTTTRELFFVPDGGMVIDTAGLREIQVFGSEGSVESVFEDLVAFTKSCRFADCSHDTEPGCAVKQALQQGELSAEEYANYQKLLRELEYSNRKMNRQLASNEKKRWKKISTNMRKKRKVEGR